MQQISLPGSPFQLSKLCMGLGGIPSIDASRSDALLDFFVENGGNFFDTAHIYSIWIERGTGASELIIGDFLRRRGLKNVVVATKGGHPSAPGYRTVDQYLSPGRIGADIDDSLGRLGVDQIDLYYLHRDDPRVPVGEIIDTLNAEVKKKRVRFLGASNWKTERIIEANAYAKKHQLQGFIISEVAWSLARAKHVGDPTLVVAGAKDIAWHTEQGMALAAYSPNSEGFFSLSPKAEANYATPENIARRERAIQLSKKYGATPQQIALAYLSCHPFPMFPISGTLNKEHLLEAIRSTEIPLSREEIRWLDQG